MCVSCDVCVSCDMCVSYDVSVCVCVCVQNGHLECVRWMVSETEAIAELSCTREHPSLIHYAARHGQVSNTLQVCDYI